MGFFKKVIRKVTKPVSKVLDKIIPNEVKPFLPYAAALAPYMLPAGFAGGSGLGALARRAALTGGLNIGAQLAQEGSEGEFSGLSALLAAGQGALTAPGAAETLRGYQTVSGTPLGEAAIGADVSLTGGGVLESAKNIGLEGLAKGAEGISGIMTAAKANPISMAGLKAAAIPFTQGTTDLAMANARKALKDYEDQLDAFNLQAGQAEEASDSARRAAIISSMTAAAFDQGIIDDTLAQLGLRDGGRVGLRDGGDPDFGGIPAAVKSVEEKPKEFLVDKLKVTVQPGQSEQMAIMNAMMNDVDGVMPEDRKMEFYKLYLPQLKASGEISEKQYEGLMGELFGEGKADGGLMGLRMGGMPMEMDYRQGGFIPVGSKERADDVPARLSKNEFVMTADAVRAAGGGSVNKGAQRMYELMNNLEARV